MPHFCSVCGPLKHAVETGNFREFHAVAGGNFLISEREFPVALAKTGAFLDIYSLSSIRYDRHVCFQACVNCKQYQHWPLLNQGLLLCSTSQPMLACVPLVK